MTAVLGQWCCVLRLPHIGLFGPTKRCVGHPSKTVCHYNSMYMVHCSHFQPQLTSCLPSHLYSLSRFPSPRKSATWYGYRNASSSSRGTRSASTSPCSAKTPLGRLLAAPGDKKRDREREIVTCLSALVEAVSDSSLASMVGDTVCVFSRESSGVFVPLFGASC